MVGCPGSLPYRGARDLQPDGNVRELCSDRLLLDDAAPALPAQLRIVEGRLIRGSPYPQIERKILRHAPPELEGERSSVVEPKHMIRWDLAVLERDAAGRAMLPSPASIAGLHAQPGRIARHQHCARHVLRGRDRDCEKLGE